MGRRLQTYLVDIDFAYRTQKIQTVLTPDIEVFGDKEATDQVVELIYRHGWRPIVRGGLDVAPDYEGGKVSFGKIWGNLKREIGKGEKLSVGW